MKHVSFGCRRGFSLSGFLWVLLIAAATLLQGEDPDLVPWVLEAGNMDSDFERETFLLSVVKTEDLAPTDREDLEVFLAFLDQWNRGKQLRWFRKPVEKERHFDFGIGPESALWPLCRMEAWVIFAQGAIWNNVDIRREWCAALRVELERISRLFPENRILKMYLGFPYPDEASVLAAPGAPAWAVYQREGIERQAAAVHWLIDHRQQPSGEYGGKWGDDCEMWRYWFPVLIAFEDSKIIAAQEKLTRGMWEQDHMRGGYTSKMSDADEHTAEDSADTLTPMMMIDPENDEWADRALGIAEFMRTRWTGINERGHLQFKSAYFTSDAIDLSPPRACASLYEFRTLQPVLLYWQRTGSEALSDLLIPWLDGWHDASMRGERGKPPGIIPSAFRWPTGDPGGVPAEWWAPKILEKDPLYFWPSASAMSMATQTFVLGWHLTGDKKYLEPVWAMAEARRTWLKDPVSDPPPGSLAWCGQQMRGLDPALAKIRMLTGTTEFDDLLSDDTNGYQAMLTTDRDDQLVLDLRNHAETLRNFFPGFSSEIRVTDRTMRFPALFTAEGTLYGAPLVGIHEPDTQLVFSSLTGEPGDGMYFPLNGVRWLTPPKDFAALARKNSRGRFSAEVFHFGKAPRAMGLELLLLEPGVYTLRLENVRSGEMLDSRQLHISNDNRRASIEIPARTLCRIDVEAGGKSN
jgi:hypothetical protein